MGGRVSVPRGPAGTTETSVSQHRPQPSRRQLNTRALLAPVLIVSLGGLFWVYSRTSIQAAKENALRHREADGGSISWRNESMRRHGSLDKPKERTLWQQLMSGKEDEAARDRRLKELKRLESEAQSKGGRDNPIEAGIRRAREGRRRGGDGEA